MVVVSIIPAEFPRMRDEIAALLLDYEREFAVDPCFHTFDAEIAGLPGPYSSAAGGAFLVALRGSGPIIGCVALKQLAPSVCEMKRLFLSPAARGAGLGHRLAEAIIEEGRRLGYGAMRLDTIRASMKSAVAIYRSLGFREIEPCGANPILDVLFMELRLSALTAGSNAPPMATEPVPRCEGREGGGCGSARTLPAR